MVSLGALLIVASGGLSPQLQANDLTWPRFRGENGVGISTLAGVPSEWTLSDYEWVRDLTGKGHSSPVVWHDRLFLTCALGDGQRTLVCFDALSGEELWSRTVTLGTNKLHLKNSYASGTPAVDSQRVYAAFADNDHYVVTAYTFTGEQVWTVDLGSYTSQHGQGVSPVLIGERLIVPNDQAGPSAIVALNTNTGDVVWSTRDRPSEEASYSTPILITGPDGKPQLICLSQAAGMSAIDPETGAQLWRTEPFPMRTCGSPVYGGGVLIGTCGSGGNGKYLAAVEPAAPGTAPKVRYTRERELPYVPTPIAHDGHLFLWLDNGVLTCLDMATGTSLKTARIGGKYSGSPVLIEGRLFCISEAGEVVVVAATPELEVLGRNPLGDESYSTPAVANGRVYLRGFHKLACLRAGGAAPAADAGNDPPASQD